MARPIEAKRFLFVIELLDLGPRRSLGQVRMSRRTMSLAATEQIRLAEIPVSLRPRAVVARRFNGRQQPRARGPQRHVGSLDQRIARAGFDQRFEYPLVGEAQVENLAQRVE